MNKRAILNTRPFLVFLLPALMVAFALMPAARVKAQTFTSLYQFTGGSDGAEPFAVVLSGITLYGTAQFGGSSGNGTVFAVNTNGTGITILHGFTANAANSSGVQTNSDGSSPGAGLVLSGNTLYGTANSGGSSGSGTVFAVNPTSPSFTNLHSFTATPPYPNLTNSDGANPQCGLIVSGNTLFGTAANGGSPGKGTVFKVNTDGTVFTNLHTFTGSSDGANPYAGLILLGNTLYGTAVGGGSSGNGTVFRINTDGTVFTNLHSFTAATYNSSIGATTNSDGANPQGGLILAGNTLYGTAANGGSSGKGTVFAVNTDGTGFTNLHSFVSGSDGANPACGLVLSGNTLYGTAPNGGTGYGTVFGMNTDGTGFTNLHSFTFSDGANPYAGMILSGNELYGAAYNGGPYGNGTVFSLSLGSVSAPTPTLAIRSSGANVLLTWPTNATGFALQSTTNLLSPVAWTNVSPGPVVINGQNTVTNPASGTNKFYRLSQ